ncbi:hypothetical protein [Catelliglobosispora koreensis]|uniref:hypothetical protein n=1 Tax=Catelliglobosispora koreensis TaxID=129052 RepID=UPI0003782FAB|nr:hypothetical protein [Catelliglobosispora koreensis]
MSEEPDPPLTPNGPNDSARRLFQPTYVRGVAYLAIALGVFAAGIWTGFSWGRSTDYFTGTITVINGDGDTACVSSPDGEICGAVHPGVGALASQLTVGQAVLVEIGKINTTYDQGEYQLNVLILTPCAPADTTSTSQLPACRS